MDDERAYSFSLDDVVRGTKLSPATISLPLFNEFNAQVDRFVRGHLKEADLKDTRVAVEDGSYRLCVIVTAALAFYLDADYAKLTAREDSLEAIDPQRAKVIQEWQTTARHRPSRRYRVDDGRARGEVLWVHEKTRFRPREDGPWVRTERYLYGRVCSIGGSKATNLHLRLPDADETLIIESTEEKLRAEQDRRNYLYHDALVHVTGEEDLRTGKLRKLRLVEFADYAPRFDEEHFARLTQAGARAWADVPDAAEWVERLRGNLDTDP